MRRRQGKVVFQDQAIGPQLEDMIFRWRTGILNIQFEFDGYGSPISELNDIIRLTSQRLLDGSKRLTLSVRIFVDKFHRRQAQCSVTLFQQAIALVTAVVVKQKQDGKREDEQNQPDWKQDVAYHARILTHQHQ